MMDGKLRVLVVDDDDDDLFLTCDYLSKVDTFDLIVDTEINYKKAVSRILLNNHDIYFVDYLLGPRTGIELISECRKAGINKPFILLTGRGDKRIDIEATKAGAYDYLTKTDLNAELIERSLRYSMERYISYTAIAESETRYREIFIKSNDIILLLDKKFKLITFNPMMNTLTGYSAEELYGQSITKLFATPEDAAKFTNHIQQNEAENKIEIAMMTKYGVRKTFLASSSLINTPDGTEQYQAILYDYTNIKKSVAEQLLRESTERLVRSMAHEIRNPLTNINLSVYELEKGLPEDKQPLTDIIKRNSTRINDLISELINLSNPVNKSDEPLELVEIVKSSLALAIDRMKLKNISLQENYTSKQAYIMGDLKKLQIAMLNIIINAVEAMEPSNGILSIETSVAGNQAMIKIKDNGEGIPTENLEHLFQPYFTRKKNGMGLGLAATHAIIYAHNGNVAVDSAIGKGTTFTVTLRAQNL
jgi:PAS domain S-box-containing protein